MLCIADAQGCFELVNPAFEKTLGYTQTDLLNRPFTEFIHREDMESTLAAMRELTEAYTAIQFDGRFRCADGTYKWLSWSMQPVPDGTRYVIARDITIRKVSEDALQKREEQFRQGIESAPIAIILVHQSGTIQLVNQKAGEIFGYTREELPGMPVESLIPEEYRHLHKENRKRYCQDPKPRSMGAGRALYGLRKDGTSFPLEIGLSTIETGGSIHIVATVVDITPRRKIEEALRQKSEILAHTNQELEQYAYVVSHDIQTPLRAIHNYAEFLSEDLEGRLEGEQKSYLNNLTRAVCQAQRLVSDLLALTRISKQDLDIVPVNLNELLKEITMPLQQHGRVEIAIAPDFPHLKSEPVLLRQIFMNLITNGIKFNESSPKKIDIGWESKADNAWEIYIRDNGIGIEPGYHEKIFRPFERLHLQSEYEGTGIGLAIIKKALQRLLGSIRMTSEPGRGSTFYITLPHNCKEDQL